MFRLFYKDLTKMDGKEIEELQRYSNSVSEKCARIKALLDDSKNWESYETQGKEARIEAEKRVKQNAEIIKDLLKEILRTLHNEEEETKKILKAELGKKH